MKKINFAILLALVFIIPWENSILIPGLGTATRIIGMVAVLTGSFLVITNRLNLKVHVFHFIFLLFILSGALTFYWTPDPVNNITRLKTYLQILLLLLIIFQFVEKVEDVHKIILAYVIGASFAIFNLLFKVSTGAPNEWQRYSSSGFNPNDLAIIIALGVPMAWYLSELKSDLRLIKIFRIYPILAFVAIAFTASRNGIMAFMLASTYPLVSIIKYSSKSKFLYLVFAITAFYATLYFIPSRSMERLGTFFSSLEGGMNSRWDIWVAGWNVFSQNPIFGAGLGAFRRAVEPIFGMQIAPHNVYLSILVEQGLVGFSIFLCLLATSITSCLRLKGDERRLWFTLLLMWVTTAMATNWEWRKQTWVILILAVTHASVSITSSFRLRTQKYL